MARIGGVSEARDSINNKASRESSTCSAGDSKKWGLPRHQETVERLEKGRGREVGEEGRGKGYMGWERLLFGIGRDLIVRS